MTLAEAIRSRPDEGTLVVCVPFFDGAELEFAWDDLQEIGPERTITAFKAFLGLTPADRSAASRHVYAYCLDTLREMSLPKGAVVPTSAEKILDHVTPMSATVAYEDHAGVAADYVQLEGECDWDPEHGLMMCWRSGQELVKVSGFDGHCTNNHAYDRKDLHDVIYQAAVDESLSTRKG